MLYPAELPGRGPFTSKIAAICQDFPRIARTVRQGAHMTRRQTAAALALALASFSASAADYPTPKQGDWIARDFKFHT
jgi:hypothetical protein